jgi:hypothetical protein
MGLEAGSTTLTREKSGSVHVVTAYGNLLGLVNGSCHTWKKLVGLLRIADIKGGAAYLSMLCGALDTHGLDT